MSGSDHYIDQIVLILDCRQAKKAAGAARFHALGHRMGMRVHGLPQAMTTILKTRIMDKPSFIKIAAAARLYRTATAQSPALWPVNTIFRSAARPIRDAAREAGRAAVRAQQAGCDKGMRPAGFTTAGPPLRVAARKRVCGVAPLGKGTTLAGATRLASIAFSRQRRPENRVNRP